MKVIITEQQLNNAKKRNTFGVLKNSIKNGEGNYLGAVGELVLMDYYRNKGAKVEDIQTFDFDFKINDYKIEVKVQECNFNLKKIGLVTFQIIMLHRNAITMLLCLLIYKKTKHF